MHTLAHQLFQNRRSILAGAVFICAVLASAVVLPTITDAQGSGTLPYSGCFSADYNGPYPCEWTPGQCLDTWGTVACPTPDPCDPTGWIGSGFTPNPPIAGSVLPDYCNANPEPPTPAPTCSTPGYEHSDGCPCSSGANSCGVPNTGSYSGGSCVTTPAPLPPGYGSSCTSGMNACGERGTGAIDCSGTCTATTPTAVDQCPTDGGLQCTANLCTVPITPDPRAGQSCSATNACGQSSTGTYSSTGVCSAVAPAATDMCPSMSGLQCSASECVTTPTTPTCTPSGACAANTCTGSTCADACGNSYAGTKTGGICTPATGCNLADPYCYCSTYPTDPWCAEGGGDPLPDITSTIAPGITPTPNVPYTLRAYTGVDWTLVTNRSWPNIFQVQSTGTGMTPVDTIVAASNTQVPYSYSYFGNNSYQQFTADYTFTQQGFYRYRSCADNNTSWQGSIDEANEGNNCSGWTTIYVNSGGACTNPVSVTGKTDADGGGGVWGSGPYSYDSDMNKAAVHAGLITRGQTAIISTNNQRTEYYYTGSYRNGVTSEGWEGWYTAVDLSLCSVTATGPNLRAGAVSPTTAGTGVAVDLTAVISNPGTASTGGSFSNLFQRATDENGANATDIGSPTMTTLGAGSSGTARLDNYTFPASGTYYVRVCADKSSAGSAGTITETDETDNCGPWTAVTVTTASISCSLSATSPIASVNSSTITWNSNNATSCTGSGFSTGGATSGSRTVTPSSTSQYGLSCTNSGSGATCNATPATVAVSGSSCTGPASVTITATPARVQPGQTSTITWSASNVPGANGSCTVSGPGITRSSSADSTSSCSLSGSATTPALNTQSTYTISCPGGATKSVIVNVLPKFEEF